MFQIDRECQGRSSVRHLPRSVFGSVLCSHAHLVFQHLIVCIFVVTVVCLAHDFENWFTQYRPISYPPHLESIGATQIVRLNSSTSARRSTVLRLLRFTDLYTRNIHRPNCSSWRSIRVDTTQGALPRCRFAASPRC